VRIHHHHVTKVGYRNRRRNPLHINPPHVAVLVLRVHQPAPQPHPARRSRGAIAPAPPATLPPGSRRRYPRSLSRLVEPSGLRFVGLFVLFFFRHFYRADPLIRSLSSADAVGVVGECAASRSSVTLDAIRFM